MADAGAGKGLANASLSAVGAVRIGCNHAAHEARRDKPMSNFFDMRCPKCGDEDHIDIAAEVWVCLTCEGTDADASGWPEVTKRSDLTHKRTNHELGPPYERHRARP
ncbi:MAG: hypothetical protein JOZ11_01475 [Alphaproteobacteria bacterium]|nr:hypothetical protein [Alphaproteobacteria bacterium]